MHARRTHHLSLSQSAYLAQILATAHAHRNHALPTPRPEGWAAPARPAAPAHLTIDPHTFAQTCAANAAARANPNHPRRPR